jgi:reactive intermediate/imine deaminase
LPEPVFRAVPCTFSASSEGDPMARCVQNRGIHFHEGNESLKKIGPVIDASEENEIHLQDHAMSENKLIRFAVADSQAGGQRRPFAKAVRAGDFVYVSGQVPTVDGEVVTGGIVAQTEQVVANIKDVLALADCTLADVVKVNVWLDDARDFSSFNAVFQKHFIDHPPARSTVQSPLMVDAKVEMDVIAYKPLA